jgi:hypothetical protein
VPDIATQSALPDRDFTLDAFRILLRGGLSPSPNPTFGLDTTDLAPLLDEAPDPATCWVYGLYATMFLRAPNAHEVRTTVNALRSGMPLEALLDDMVSSAEARAAGAEVPDDLGLAYVTGCFLAVLGRPPDPGGLQAYLGRYASTGDQQGVLDAFMSSEEAMGLTRFPPAPYRLELAVAQALQTLVLRRHPTDELSQELIAEYRGGVPIRALVVRTARRHGGIRVRLKALFLKEVLAALVILKARLRKLAEDVRTDREWEWRVTRQTWTNIALLHQELGDREQKVSPSSEAEEKLPANRASTW